MNVSLRTIAVAVFAALLGFMVFFDNFEVASMRQFVNYDTDQYILGNESVTGTASLHEQLLTPEQGYPIPITVMIWRTVYHTYGADPQAFGVLSTVLWTTCVLLFFGVALRVFRSVSEQNQGEQTWWLGFLAAVVAALVYWKHPINVEAALWAMGVKDLLASIFLLLMVHLYLSERAIRNESNRGVWLHIAMGGAFLLACLSKPTAIGFALMPLGLDWAFDRKVSRSILRLTVGTSCIAVSMVTIAMFLNTSHGADRVYVTLMERLVFTPAYLLHEQLAHLIVPLGLLPRYMVEVPVGWSFEAAVQVGTFIVVASLLCVGIYKGSTQVKIGCLLLLLGYGPIGGFVTSNNRALADSYMLLPMTGISLLFGAGVYHTIQKCVEVWNDTGSRVVLTRIVACTTLLGIGAIVCSAVYVLDTSKQQQENIWQDGPSMWAAVVDAYPQVPQACNSWAISFVFEPTLELPDPTSYAGKLRYENALQALNTCYPTRLNPEPVARNRAFLLRALGHTRDASCYEAFVLSGYEFPVLTTSYRESREPYLNERGDVYELTPPWGNPQYGGDLLTDVCRYEQYAAHTSLTQVFP